MSSILGEKIKVSVFGGSHTAAIGCTIDGFPASVKVKEEQLLAQMKRRAPGQDKASTPRKEADTPEVLCGILNGVTTGEPITAIIRNTNTASKDYESLRHTFRPGHADYTAHVKYGGSNDIRGGGHFSGRLTAPFVFAGALCEQLLAEKGIKIAAHVSSVGEVLDTSFDKANVDNALMERLHGEYFPTISAEKKAEMYELIERVRNEGDSIGGVVECMIDGLSAGVGEPMFGGIENRLSAGIFGIPAVKAVEFGDGFLLSQKKGSEANDEFYYAGEEIKTRTNSMGGILGGISTGMPIVFRAGFKPTPSIAKAQKTVNVMEKKDVELEIKGRHDPCIVPRAVPVVEAVAAIVVADMIV